MAARIPEKEILSPYNPFVESQAPILSSSQVQEILDAFQEKIQSIDANSFPALLEFCSMVRLSKDIRSWRDLFAAFEIKGDILKKYGGGTNIIVAIAAQELLSSMGHHGEIVRESRIIPQACLYPAPSARSAPLKWPNAIETLQGYSHLICVLPFKDEQEQAERAIVLREYFSQTLPSIYPSWNAFTQEFQKSNKCPLVRDSHPMQFIKMNMQINLILIAWSKRKSEKCRLNLLDGTLAVEPGKWPDLPSNLDRQANFSIIDLMENPEESLGVFINGERVNLLKKQILSDYLSVIQREFQFPEDFQENLLFLIENRGRFFSEIALEPANVLYKIWPLYKEVDLIRQQAQSIISEGLRRGARAMLIKANDAFAKATSSLQTPSSEDEVRENLLHAQERYTRAMELAAKELNTPIAILLEGTSPL